MRKKTIFILIISSIAAAAIVFAAAGSIYTSSSRSCSFCHEMRTYDVSWQGSSHGNVACMDCHGGLGSKGFIMAKWGGIQKTISHFSGDINVTQAEVSDPVCLKCHLEEDLFKFDFEAGFRADIVFSQEDMHKIHMKKADIACMSCHYGLVHGTLGGGLPVQYTACEECHTEKGIMLIKPVEWNNNAGFVDR